jgi:CheY-like chemotaxis protein
MPRGVLRDDVTRRHWTMTRVLIVNRDHTVADRIAAELRAHGYETEQCGGPQQEACPVVGELPCPLVDRADVLVYDAHVAGDSESDHRLVSHLRDVYADLPVILTSTDPSLDWVQRTGPERVTPLAGDPQPADLRAAIETALEDQGMAV